MRLGGRSGGGKRALVALGIAAAVLAGSTPVERGGARADWVEETLASLDLRERVAQLVMVWMSGGYAAATDPEYLRVERLVRESGIGGIVISLGTPDAYVSRLNRLQDVAETPLLVAADFEAGPGYRVGGVYALPNMMDMGGATSFPPAMAFGATDDEALAYEAGRITAIEARALGVHLNFAPVLDVNNNPDNPIINTRAFGEDPERVAALGAAYIRGARAGGLLSTAKHFPGHGDTETDSHVALPLIPGDRVRLDRIELVPFRRAIAEGVEAVMTAHVAAPQILGSDAPPATLSPYFMTQLLREELGFEGVLFTDALDMSAIVDRYGAGETAVLALEAGADVLLMPEEPALAIEAVVSAVEGGRLSAERIDDSVRRLLRLKTQAGLDRDRLVAAARVSDLVGIEAHTSFADTVARRSLTLVRDDAQLIPLAAARPRSALSFTFARTRDLAAGRVFDRRLAESMTVARLRAGFETPPRTYDSLAAEVGAHDFLIISAYVRPRATEGPTDLPDGLRRLAARAAAEGVPTVLVSFGSPYFLTELTAQTESPAYLLAWGGGEASQRAAADGLLGRAHLSGRLPISLPPLYAIGTGLDRPTDRARPIAARPRHPDEVDAREVGMDPAGLSALDRLLEAGARDGVAPGMAIAVGRHGRLVRLRGYGRLDWAPGSPSASPSSVYDLASLTKVVATTTAVMQLVDDGRLTLESRIAEFLPEWSDSPSGPARPGRDWKRDVTVRDLLLHRGGLPPFRPFWRTLEGRRAYRDAIAGLEAEYVPGTQTVYSDIGLITLAFVVEAITGRTLDAHLESTVFGPLQMTDTGFNPSISDRSGIAPTEVDTTYRYRHLVGEVHDENGFALGGVAGHAGLFSSARDLARFSTWILAAAREGRGLGSEGRGLGSAEAFDPPDSLPSSRTVGAFTRRADGRSSRALGWDTPSDRSSAGRFFGRAAFGHTGFTGTSIWIDPELDLFVVLLTNRVNPTRDNRSHIPFRRAVHDAVAAAITDVTVEPRP